MEEPIDDEAEFWKRFFESIQPFRIAISGTLSNLADTPPVKVIRKTMAVIEAVVEPDSLANHIGWESVAFIGIHGRIIPGWSS